jgi:hypothetical protein
MQKVNQPKTNQFLSDLNFHFESLKTGISTLQIDCNRNDYIYLLCDKLLQKIAIIEKIIFESNLKLPIVISTEVNRLFILDKTLSIVTVIIVNSKREYRSDRIATLKLTT